MARSNLTALCFIATFCILGSQISAVPVSGDDATPVILNAFSVMPGQWVAYANRPVTQEELNPFVGQFLLAGQWPEGVQSPDDPKVLLLRDRLAATRIVAVKAESGGRRIRLTADPVVSPETYSLSLGSITVRISFQGLAATIGAIDDDSVGPKPVLPSLMDRKVLGDIARIDPYADEIARAWSNTKIPLRLGGWLRLAEGVHQLQFDSGRSFTIDIGGMETVSEQVGDRHVARVEVESAGMEQELKWTFPPTDKPILSDTVFVNCRVGQEQAAKPLDPSQLLVPWAPETLQETPSAFAEPPYELTGGDPERGRTVFYSEKAKCSTCHTVDGQGGKVGPDLSGLKGARPELVFHHVNTPSDRIHPGFPSFSIALKGGQVAMGVVRALEGEMLEVLDTDARSLKVSTFDVAELRPSASSVMPAGLAGAVGEKDMRDLIAFLTSEPVEK